ncbi:MAG TPA: hypothetical protein VIW48_02760, partial [Nitrospiraceae bacterium]
MPDRSGETGGPPPKGILTLQPPFFPITISIDTSGRIAIIASPVKLVSLLGTVTFGVGVFKDLTTGRPLPDPRLRAVTQLVICQKDRVEEPCKAYEIGSARKVHIVMNGSFFQDVEQNLIRIDASPGSTIIVTDNGPTTKLASQSTEPSHEDVEEFNFSATGADTDVDLERSRSGTAADLSYDHITAVLKAINGAKVSLYATHSWWTKPSSEKDYPSENECRNKRPEDWKEKFSED